MEGETLIEFDSFKQISYLMKTAVGGEKIFKIYQRIFWHYYFIL